MLNLTGRDTHWFDMAAAPPINVSNDNLAQSSAVGFQSPAGGLAGPLTFAVPASVPPGAAARAGLPKALGHDRCSNCGGGAGAAPARAPLSVLSRRAATQPDCVT